jgi:hypothetical protein
MRLLFYLRSNICFPSFYAGSSPLCYTLLLHPALLYLIWASPAHVRPGPICPLTRPARGRLLEKLSSLPWIGWRSMSVFAL